LIFLKNQTKELVDLACICKKTNKKGKKKGEHHGEKWLCLLYASNSNLTNYFLNDFFIQNGTKIKMVPATK
jgi:hypothetical protein